MHDDVVRSRHVLGRGDARNPLDLLGNLGSLPDFRLDEDVCLHCHAPTPLFQWRVSYGPGCLHHNPGHNPGLPENLPHERRDARRREGVDRRRARGAATGCAVIFRDRQEAGRLLGERLARPADTSHIDLHGDYDQRLNVTLAANGGSAWGSKVEQAIPRTRTTWQHNDRREACA